MIFSKNRFPAFRDHALCDELAGAILVDMDAHDLVE
jgi:hypothetical protein